VAASIAAVLGTVTEAPGTRATRAQKCPLKKYDSYECANRSNCIEHNRRYRNVNCDLMAFLLGSPKVAV
jgi:hypothetical protein